MDSENTIWAPIESLLEAASPLIGHACCIGDGRAYNSALIVLDHAAMRAWVERRGLPADLEGLAAALVKPEIQRAIDATNSELPDSHAIKRFSVLHQEWLPDGQELSGAMTLNRRLIAEKYAMVIDCMYA